MKKKQIEMKTCLYQDIGSNKKFIYEKKKILYTSIIDKIYKLFGIADNRLFTQLPPFTHYDHRLLIVSKNSFRGFIYFFFILKKKKCVSDQDRL